MRNKQTPSTAESGTKTQPRMASASSHFIQASHLLNQKLVGHKSSHGLKYEASPNEKRLSGMGRAVTKSTPEKNTAKDRKQAKTRVTGKDLHMQYKSP